ncbi:type II toxin-antitoxin system PemK/MazF family toxin [Candidatus Berkelbacteria bacterium]|nr:type II toxin-antitoxin system PemK/MazF family toxin [Candidatus Berkelbacteria bacterium]
MADFVAGDVVVVRFPYSDLQGSKRRPALVLAQAEFENLILCQITSRAYTSRTAVRLVKSDVVDGALPVTSYVRPDKLFTAEPIIIEKHVGRVTTELRQKILARVRKIFRD